MTLELSLDLPIQDCISVINWRKSNLLTLYKLINNLSVDKVSCLSTYCV